MNNFISKETAEELKKMGCNVPTVKYIIDERRVSSPVDICTLKGDSLYADGNEWFGATLSIGYNATPTYDLGEIVTNFGLAKVFFGERKVCRNSGEGLNYHGSCGECMLSYCFGVPEYFFRTTEIKNHLLKNEKEEAEKHLLKYCVFTH